MCEVAIERCPCLREAGDLCQAQGAMGDAGEVFGPLCQVAGVASGMQRKEQLRQLRGAAESSYYSQDDDGESLKCRMLENACVA